MQSVVDEFFEGPGLPFERMTAFRVAHPDAVGELARVSLDRAPDGGTWFDALLSHVPEQSLAALIAEADRRVRAGETSKAIVAVGEQAAMQAPHVLRRHPRLAEHDNVTHATARLAEDPPPCRHIVFPVGYFKAETVPWLAHENHPTWSLDSPEATEAAFGGTLETLCHVCHGALHRLIALNGSRAPTADDRRPLIIATCLSCLGWEEEELFYRHDDDGVPSDTGERGDRFEPQFPAVPLKPTTVRVTPTPPRWRRQDWGLSNSRENLNRISAEGTWVQDVQRLECPDCEAPMPLLVQFDSELPTTADNGWLWGSGGICYVRWCAACRISGLFWQCT